jgi:hypothetical protein
LDNYPSCTYRYAIFEPGVLQKDAVSVNVSGTLLKVSQFLSDLFILEQEETQHMQQFRPDIVCSDAAFLPIHIAKTLNIPSILITNFTFDAIYRALATTEEEHEWVNQCQEMYTGASHLLRLPGYITIPSFEHRNDRVHDLPVVVRKSRLSSTMVRSMLNIELDKPVVLISFGGHELFQAGKSWSAQAIIPQGWVGVVIGPGKEVIIDPNGQTEDTRLLSVRSEDWYLPDLLNACDVILSKCGYGMCSETVAHHKPLVYVPRPLFVEEVGLLENLMHPYGIAVELSQDDFYAGRWIESIQKAYDLRSKKKKLISTDGDWVACEWIEELAVQLIHEA